MYQVKFRWRGRYGNDLEKTEQPGKKGFGINQRYLIGCISKDYFQKVSMHAEKISSA